MTSAPDQRAWTDMAHLDVLTAVLIWADLEDTAAGRRSGSGGVGHCMSLCEGHASEEVRMARIRQHDAIIGLVTFFCRHRGVLPVYEEQLADGSRLPCSPDVFASATIGPRTFWISVRRPN